LAALDLATGRHHTYQAFNERIARLAGSLRRNHGIAVGDRVAILAPNTTFEVQFACGRLGAIFVPLNWRLANPELLAILADCTPAVLIYDPEFAERAEQLAQARGIGHLVSLGLAFERIALDGPRLDQPAAPTLDDTATILYTFGTTGLPKHTIISHGMNFSGTACIAWPTSTSSARLCFSGCSRCSIAVGSTCSPIRRFRPAEP
jgi:fatty-acyl-CoA synthase